MGRAWLVLVLAGVAACKFDPRLHPGGGGDDAMVGSDGSDGHAAAPWMHPWKFRKAITLHKEQIAGALTDFPVAIVLPDAEITNNVAKMNGDDLVFTKDDGTTPLLSDIETLNKASGNLIAWVKVPDLSPTADTTLYLYYGNDAAPKPMPQMTWTNGFFAVWHLQEDPSTNKSGDIKDAAKNHDGTPTTFQAGSSVNGQVGVGIQFDGADDFINYASADIGSEDVFTLSMWVKYAGTNDINTLFANSNSGRNVDGFKVFINSVGTMNRRFEIESGNGNSGTIAETDDNAVPVDMFAHLAIVIDRPAAKATLFVNGMDKTLNATITADFKANSDYEVARMEDNQFHFKGILDEVEIATVKRDATWLRTAYNNQNQPNAFHTVGAQESEPPQ